MAPEECSVELRRSCCSSEKEAVSGTSAALWKHFPLAAFPSGRSRSSCCQVPALPPSPAFPRASSPGTAAVLAGERVASVRFLALGTPSWKLQGLPVPLLTLKLWGSTLAKRLRCARRCTATCPPFVWTTPVPRDVPGWCSPWFCLPRGGVTASYSLVLYVKNEEWSRLAALSTARGAELGVLLRWSSCNGRGAKEGLVLPARLGISEPACEQVCCHHCPLIRLTCSEIACLLGVLPSYLSDSKLVCWQKGMCSKGSAVLWDGDPG